MPKATKKKKERATDFSVRIILGLRVTCLAQCEIFQKAKLKLGKGKKLPVNQVDTSFKARCMVNLLSCRSSLPDFCMKSYCTSDAEHHPRERR